jgi:uncharacterized hydantoinase/oxoprolinase family protein
MICADGTMFNQNDAWLVAEHVRSSQLAQLRTSLARAVASMSAGPEWIVVGGAGEFLAVRVSNDLWPKERVVSLRARIGEFASECGPAHALAVLAEEGG